MMPTTFGAMGTQFEVRGAPDPGTAEIVREVERYEQMFSRFRQTSELSAINRNPGPWQTVSSDMAEVLELARQAAAVTGGLVDISIGSTLRRWGYDRPLDQITEGVRPAGPSLSGAWDLDGRRVRVAHGTSLDLGGIVKGWVCDRIVGAGDATLVSAGGDLRSADAGMVVDLVDPTGTPYASIGLGYGGVATSSQVKRTWTTTRGTAHHLIDPRTLAPTDSPVLQATVVAATAVDAEIGAKAVLLRGVDGLAWADAQPWIRQAVVLWHDGSVFSTKLEAAA